MRKTTLILLFTIVLGQANAQVTIGSGKTPELFSTLEIDSQVGGLRYPQIDNATKAGLSLDDRANGLVVFNTSDDGCLEYYVDETDWVNLCGGQSRLATEALVEEYMDSRNYSNLQKKYHLSFPNDLTISHLRAGQFHDVHNIVSNVEVKTTTDSNTFDIHISLHPLYHELLDENLAPKATIYAIYTSDGINKRLEFTID